MAKYVYFFSPGETEGSAKMKELLGGKGANLAEMTQLGIPVPPGFTISTEVCDLFYQNNRNYPQGLEAEVDKALARLEQKMGKKLGDANDPLLVSVRSGAAVSMPGMMDTILNLGLSDAAVEGLSERTGNPRFAWDAYRRFIQMFGDVVYGVGHDLFEHDLESVKKKKKVSEDVDLDTADLKHVVTLYKKTFRRVVGKDFPQDPRSQLWDAINAVFGSWMNDRAIKYRAINSIKSLKGTAVNVQSMVYGNLGDSSGTGVAFSRDASTGEKVFYGEYLMNAQGEDVVAGIRTPKKIAALKKQNPSLYAKLEDVKDRLERHYRDMQDLEFTIQDGELFLLQTRNGKRTGVAAVRIAVEMVSEGLITQEEAVARVTPDQLDQVFHPMIDPKAKKEGFKLAKGLNASPGAASGRVVFTAADAEAKVKEGWKVVLVRKETSPEDIGGMHVAEGVLTSTGGMTSHAAVVARGMGTPCVAGAKDIEISGKVFTAGGRKVKEGEFITIDGTTGEIYSGQLSLISPKIAGELTTFLGWADEIRKAANRKAFALKGFGIRTNADTPADAKRARDFGAEGIGLCRTEHMFFEEGKLELFRQMIVADDVTAREAALKKLLPLQKKDFTGIFKAMAGLPVTIRLLDPPLHEFLPTESADIKEISAELGISPAKLKAKVQSLHELNPMLGHRGCRLGITYPEIYDMQVEAIMTAAADLVKKGIDVKPEIMIPLVGSVKELEILRSNAESVAASVVKKKGVKVDYSIGTMIEIPRAALIADEIADVADFFSFGTNDLTQMTLGFSRDDVAKFLPIYVEQGILDNDPFAVLDQHGVGQLVQGAAEKARKQKPGIKLGICGEHGGEASSIDFCYRVGMDYVSCSPFRVPIARLAAAQSVVAGR